MSPAAACAHKLLVLAGLCLGLPASSFAQSSVAPSGSQYPISGAINGEQVAPSLSLAASGGWVVWQDNGVDGKGHGIAARRLDHNANAVGGYFRVNGSVIGDQERPKVSVLQSGGAAVAWQGGNLGFQEVFARFLNADGSFATDEIIVSDPPGQRSERVTTNMLVVRNNKAKQKNRRLKNSRNVRIERTGSIGVTTLLDGSVVVVYAGHRQISTATQVPEERVKRRGNRDITNTVLTTVYTFEDNMQDVFFQRFTSAGEKIGSLVRVNQFTSLNQHHPSVVALANGGFVIAWTSEQQHGSGGAVIANNFESVPVGPGFNEIFARVFDSAGAPVTDDFRVNTSDLPCNNATLAPSGEAGFVVTWAQKHVVRDNSLDIWARSYSARSTAAGEPFLVNTTTYGDQYVPQIAALPAGHLIVWTSLQQDGSREGVYGRYIAGGAPSGAEFRVNTTTRLRQLHPSVAANGGSQAVVIWSSYQTEAGFDLFGQRYTAP